MRKSAETLPTHTQQFLLSKISRVQQELNKLSNLISNDEQLNNNIIRNFLDQQQISSESSSKQKMELEEDNNILYNISEHMQHNQEISNDTFSETISKLSLIKSKENDTTTMLKQEEEKLLQTINLSSKENFRTQQNINYLLEDHKNCKLSEKTKQIFKANFLEMKSKQKGMLSGKSSRCLNNGSNVNSASNGYNNSQSSGYKSTLKNNPLQKKSKQLISPFLSKRKSTKPAINTYKSSDRFEKVKKVVNIQIPNQKCFIPVSPKLNKINGNRFRQNLKKTIEIQNQQQGLHSKFHLNLSDHKTLMLRVIQKNNFQKLYEQQTKKYQGSMKTLTQSIIMSQLDNDFRSKSQYLKLIMVFLSQFSETIRKFFKDKPQQIQLKFTELIKETILMLVKLPSKLYRNNYVSSIRYQSLINSKIANRKANSKLEQAAKSLRDYVIFLSKHGLIEMTERQTPHSDRKILEYYSHRSKQDKPKTKGKLLQQVQQKVSNKQYDTERQYISNKQFPQSNYNKQKSPVLKTKIVKLQKRISAKTRPPINPSNQQLKKIKSQEFLKLPKDNASQDFLRKRL